MQQAKPQISTTSKSSFLHLVYGRDPDKTRYVQEATFCWTASEEPKCSCQYFTCFKPLAWFCFSMLWRTFSVSRAAPSKATGANSVGGTPISGPVFATRLLQFRRKLKSACASLPLTTTVELGCWSTCRSCAWLMWLGLRSGKLFVSRPTLSSQSPSSSESWSHLSSSCCRPVLSPTRWGIEKLIPAISDLVSELNKFHLIICRKHDWTVKGDVQINTTFIAFTTVGCLCSNLLSTIRWWRQWSWQWW